MRFFKRIQITNLYRQTLSVYCVYHDTSLFETFQIFSNSDDLQITGKDSTVDEHNTYLTKREIAHQAVIAVTIRWILGKI